jgi:hypothetical protein
MLLALLQESLTKVSDAGFARRLAGTSNGSIRPIALGLTALPMY